MDDLDAMARQPAFTYCCSVCSRCFVDPGKANAGTKRCPCGASLAPRALPPGLYEVQLSVAEAARELAAPLERDVGYGASHGNDATHGGPSGPGDAPADVR